MVLLKYTVPKVSIPANAYADSDAHCEWTHRLQVTISLDFPHAHQHICVCMSACVCVSVYMCVCGIPNVKLVSFTCMPNEPKSTKCEIF